MVEIKKIKTNIFEFQRYDQFAANPNMRRSDQVSLVVDVLDRLPFQPPYPANHSAMNWFRKDPTLRGRDFVDQMLMTDEAFHKWSRQQAVKHDIEDKVFSRWLTERQLAEKHAKQWVFEEDKRRFVFFQKAALLRAIAGSKAAQSRLADLDKTLRAEYEATLRRDVVNDHNEQVTRKMAHRVQELSAQFTWSQADLDATLTDLSLKRQASVQLSTEEAANVLRFAAQMALKNTVYVLAAPGPEAHERAMATSTAKLVAKKVS
jgi:hypothetical protein